VTEVAFEVACRSVFAALSTMLDDLYADGAIADAALVRRLQSLLERAETAREGHALPGPPAVLALHARSCAEVMGAFADMVGASPMPAANAAMLVDRASDVAAHYCGGGTRRATLP
jgi:hypothetical protein